MRAPDACISEFIPLSTHVSPTVLKTTGGDYAMVWRLEGLPFVGRDAWELEHRHNTFNRMLQTLRAPDFVNVAFWSHDIRRRTRLRDTSRFDHLFNQQLSNAYYGTLSSTRLMQNELYLTMLYRPVVGGRRFAEKSASLDRLQAQQDHAIATVLELAGNVEAVLRDYAPTRLRMYESSHGVVFSEALELYGYLLNRVDERVPVLPIPAGQYLPTSRLRFSSRSGDFAITTPHGTHHYGAILNVKEYAEGSYPGMLNGLKYLDFEYVITHSFSPMGRHDALKALERTKGMMISSGDRAVSQIAELDQAMDQLASGNFVLGQYHFSMAIYAASQEELARQLAQTRAELSNAGFVTVKEDLAVTAAFYAQFPGNWKFRTRLANVSSLNFLGLSPLHNFATG
ncbi:MAG TPA: VirB4 family type IV secretion/conjugal transfer ATPase, partial [Dyella sp.]